ncbi:MAG TPA: ArsI/CadI family heavy metal resistance metalloenzyme [Arenicellales bacterium]|nr:ArsI/CadI family heavy metal resistance metalloenzyme [Arenicellales bacterium]
MKRLHIHVGVDDLDRSIRFYTALFGADPVKTKEDYAKWMLDDPSVNFAISTRARGRGVDHLGLQADEEGELEEIRQRLASADMATFDEGETVCCYARSDKTWVQDPAGVAWEAYRTMNDAQVFAQEKPAGEQACCVPEPAAGPDASAGSDRNGECCDR